jgi:predicted ribosomally synthesized peptide with SipW-like signal peptide
MRSIRLVNPVLRAIGVIGIVAGLVTGVTFAALNDKAVLADSTLSTPTANLTIWDGDSFESTAPGFTVTDLVPGSGSSEQLFYLKNGVGLNLDVTAHVPTAPAEPAGGYGFSGFENVKVKFTNKHSGESVNTTMAALMAGEVALPGNPLPNGAQGDGGTPDAAGNFGVVFDIDPDAVTGDHAGVGNFNVVFSGTQAGLPTDEPEGNI